MTDHRTFPALFSYGFRPFFLFAGIHAAATIVLWVANVTLGLNLTGALDPLSWHIHEMIWGFAAAAVAGFALTAIPNWTGRLPIAGRPLMGLALLWVLGRCVVLLPGVPLIVAAVLDVIFPFVLALAAMREIAAGHNWRNLPVVTALVLFAGADVVFWLEHAGTLPFGGYGYRFAISILLALITLIGGRIIPSFTRNWLVKRGATRLPTPFGPYDKLVLLITVVAQAAWTWAPDGPVVGALTGLAAAANLVRLSRWQGLATGAEPLLWILHVAYLWIPIGFGLAALAALHPQLVPQTAAIHTLTVGAIAQMILAVMTRATLGHTGRALTADRTTTAAYLALWLAAAIRIAAAFVPLHYDALITTSAALWVAAFLLFLAGYGPKLCAARSSHTS
ncbi:MAG: NnrS family protein [Rhodospirillaceae bacterium]|nr:NnrS family protein [Rhodospirillaceae bacterium]